MSRSPFDRRDLAAIAAGGVVGAVSRWLIAGAPADDVQLARVTEVASDEFLATLAFHGDGFPWQMLTANLIGTLLLGVVVTLRSRSAGSRRLWLGLGTGVCGSLTTFSTFAVDVARRLRSIDDDVIVGIGLDPSDPLTLLTPSSGVSQADGITLLVVSVVAAAIAFALGRMTALRFSA